MQLPQDREREREREAVLKANVQGELFNTHSDETTSDGSNSHAWNEQTGWNLNVNGQIFRKLHTIALT